MAELQAPDLRIGNKMLRKFWNPEPKNEHYAWGECEVVLIKPDSINIKIKGGHIIGKVPFENVNPIPLNEFWLDRFGFEIKTDDNGISDAFLGENPITKDWLIKLVNTSGIWFYRNAHFQIHYVHQLQNLYFALTGQELTA